MALEPITRKEKIIAGENLEPITRMEQFLKKFGGSGVPDGGTVGQLLGKTESGTAWVDPPQSGGSVTKYILIQGG